MSGILMAGIPSAAHPGSGIVVDRKGQVFFIDTGQGVWKIDRQGKLRLVHDRAYHWMALDEEGRFARTGALGSFDGGSFERVTPVIISSDYPITVGLDGALYYVPYRKDGPRQLVRKRPDGMRSVAATLPPDAGNTMQWVNGIATGPDGAIYVTDNDAVLKVTADGRASTVAAGIRAPDCSPGPAPDTSPGSPYLRGLAVHANGAISAAATGCRAVIRIDPSGAIRTILKAESPWSPTGVAIFGEDTYVLEYTHVPTQDRRDWIPRVRKVAADGRVTTVATVRR